MPDESDTAQRGVNPAGTPDAGATSAETVDRPNAPAAVGSIQPGASASRRVRARLAQSRLDRLLRRCRSVELDPHQARHIGFRLDHA